MILWLPDPVIYILATEEDLVDWTIYAKLRKKLYHDLKLNRIMMMCIMCHDNNVIQFD